MNKIIEEDIKDILADNQINWALFKNKTVLVTGANGMLPAYLVFTFLYLNNLYDYNVTVIAVVRNMTKAENKFKEFLSDRHLKFIVQDISFPLNISDNVHYIIHAASQASPKYYTIDPVGTINANILGTINTLSLAKDKQVDSYLFFSTSEVYGIVNPEHFPFIESDYGYIDLLNVRSCYAESKRMGENLCVAWNYQYGVPSKIVRIFHTFGPGVQLDDHRVFADFCSNIIKNEDIVLKSDGSAVRLFCYITDAVKAYIKVLLEGHSCDAYNVANIEGEISILNLAKMLINLYPEKKIRIKFDIKNNSSVPAEMQNPIKRVIPDCSKIYSLGWKPVVSIEECFKRTIASYNCSEHLHNK